MNKRERILIIAMVIALILGGISVYLDISKRKAAKNTAPGAIDLTVGGFADTQRAALGAVRLHPGEKLALDKAAGPWAESPFIDRISSIRTDMGVVTEFHYTGYMQLGDTVLAIINGREYRESESLLASDFVVESIEPDHVVLAAGQGGRRMTISLQTANAGRNQP